MKNILLAITLLYLLPGCTKEYLLIPEQQMKDSVVVNDSNAFPKYEGSNPVSGKWLIGRYSRWCGDDSTVYENNNGNFFEFRSNDTVYVTYVTNNSTGWSPYSVIDAETLLINGVLQKIISIDENHFTVYHEEQNGWVREWSVFLKYPETSQPD